MISPVICLAGPTGSGKTRIAIELARRFNCEIINSDSRQVYSDFPIITAQPSLAERQGIPHYLYGYLPLAQGINAGSWATRAIDVARDIAVRGRIPLFTGGTGLYFNAILNGLARIPPVSPDISSFIAESINREGSRVMHEKLQRIDPVYAAKVHPNDRHRIQRALEVWHATGQTFTWWHHASRPEPAARGPLLVTSVTLDELEPVLAKRIDIMLAQGAIEEARHALEKYPGENPGWSGIGCAELRLYLQGEISLVQCRKLWLYNTRAYAKRQLTWFRARKNAIWIDPHNLDWIIELTGSQLINGV